MILKQWNELPNELKNEQTKEYYNILKKKKIILILKRALDIIISLVLLIILLPIFFIIAILIKIDSKGTVFYLQERVTTYGKTFKMFKFRTMIEDADKKGELLTLHKDDRITRVGKKLRKCRLDEIPQLINILKGDMSFVGTRPEIKKYVNMYTDEMKATLLMPAGLTSMASIKYKDEEAILDKYIKKGEKIDDIYKNIILPEKMKLNLDYIKKISILEDIKIEIKTVMKVGK